MTNEETLKEINIRSLIIMAIVSIILALNILMLVCPARPLDQAKSALYIPNDVPGYSDKIGAKVLKFCVDSEDTVIILDGWGCVSYDGCYHCGSEEPEDSEYCPVEGE